MTEIETLKTQVNNLFDKINDKNQISELTQIRDTISLVEAATQRQQDQLTDVMRDYKDLIKHTSFAITKQEDDIQPKPAKTLDEIIAQVLKK